MNEDKLIEICKERDEMDFLYGLTKIVAESDSIGEGWGYCDEYTKERFNEAKRRKKTKYQKRGDFDDYLDGAGFELYELYLKQIGVV
jgi:hypothetical protein